MKKLCIALCALLLVGCVRIPKDALQLSPESLQYRQLQTRRFETTDKSTMLAAAAAVLQDLGFNLDEAEVPLGVLVGSKQRDAVSGAQVAGALLVAVLGGGAMPIDEHQTIRVSMVMRENPANGNESDTSAEKKLLTPIPAADLLTIQKSLEKSIASSLKKYHSPEISSSVAQKTSANAIVLLEKDIQRVLAVETRRGDSIVRVTFQRIIYNSAGQISKAEQINEPEIYQNFYEKLSKSVFLEAHEL